MTQSRTTAAAQFPFPQTSPWHLLVTAVAGIGPTAHDWQARASARAHLADLDRRLLDDMGMTADDAAQEAAKPFWKR